MKPGDQIDFVSDFRATCACGQEIEVGEVDGVPCVIHLEPYCKQFLELELLDYLRWVNASREGLRN